VAEVYMGLSSGPLAQAVVVDLPDGLAMHAGDDITITRARVAEAIAAEPLDKSKRTLLEAEAFYVLETLAVEPLMTSEARRWAAQQPGNPAGSGDALIDSYLDHIADQVTVDEDDARAFYDENEGMFGGQSFESVKDALVPFVLQQKQQDAVRAHIGSLSSRTPVKVDAAFLAQVAPKALASVVDQARRSGRPSFVDFGADGCQACEMMKPIIGELEQTHGERANVLMVQVREQPYLSSRYGVRAIPVQVIFDAEGKEVYRHTGFLAKDRILEHLGTAGVE
jgi:thiol-disulfide isomerase/thioredoxin